MHPTKTATPQTTSYTPPGAGGPLHVLLVDDEPEGCQQVAGALRNRVTLQADLTICETADAARTALAERAFDVVLLAHPLREGSGLHLLREALGASPPPVVLLTDSDGDDALEAADMAALVCHVMDRGELTTRRLERCIRLVMRRAQQEAGLRESREFYRAAFAGLTECAAILDDGGRILTVNNAWRHCAGDDCDGLPLTEVVARFGQAGADDQTRIRDGVQRVLAGDAVFQWEYFSWRGDDERWISIRVAEFPEQRRRLLLATLGDVTARKRTEHELRENEERYRLVARATKDIIWVYDLATGRVEWNEALAAVLGYEERITDYIWWAERLHPQDAERVVDGFRRAVVSGESAWSDEYRFRRADGSYATIYDRAYLQVNGRGEAVRMIGAMMDLSERQEAAEALRASGERLRAFIDHAADQIFIIDPQGALVDANIAACEALGYSRDALIGRNVSEIAGTRSAEQLQELWDRALAGETVTVEGMNRRRDGSAYPVEVRLRAVRTGSRSVIVSIARDLTERLRAETALRQSEQRYRALLEAAHEGICAVDRVGRITYVNPRLADLLNLRESELVGRAVFDFLEESDALQARNRFAALQRGKSESREARVRRPSGDYRWVLQSASPLKAADGSFAGALYLMTDLTSRREVELALRESERRLATLMSQIPGMAYRCHNDEHWTVEFVSDGALDVTGYAPHEMVDNRAITYADLIHPEDRQRVWDEVQAALSAGKPFELAYRICHRDGTVRRVQERGRLVPGSADGIERLEGLIVDVTRQHLLEEQLHQSQKMEAIGRLAGGVAHDFNNLLTVIGSYTAIAREEAGAGSPLLPYLEQIAWAAERSASLTRQLLAFSRRQVLQPREVELRAVVAGMDTMLRRLIGEDIQLETVVAPELGLVVCDPGQIEQVVMNLVVNARDAMPNGGRLTIDLKGASVDSDQATRLGLTRGGRYVQLSVTDTGHGMDASTMAHLFEPFFTTKPAGKGTGLGLSTVYGIVKQSGGTVTVDSVLGKGSTFRVFLPEAESRALPGRDTDAAPAKPTRSGASILVVEDEETVRGLACRVLRREGYRVLEAANAGEALLICEQHPDIELVLTDVVMPRMGGADLVRRLRQLRPRLRVIFMTGYTDDALVPASLREPDVALIEKPFSPSALVQKVNAVLVG